MNTELGIAPVAAVCDRRAPLLPPLHTLVEGRGGERRLSLGPPAASIKVHRVHVASQIRNRQSPIVPNRAIL